MIRAAWRLWRDSAAPWLRERLAGRRAEILGIWPPAPALGARVALLAHFDAAGQVSADVLGYAGALRDCGFSVVLVSNAGRLDAAARAAALEVCAGVILRRNRGWDFAAWRDALAALALPRAGTHWLLLTNDSLLGPFRPLAEVFARCTQADFWGLTENLQGGAHLQSYFLLLGPTALHSAAWRRFWAGLRTLANKHAVIRRYEIGLTRQLRAAGLHGAALFPTPPDGANPTLRHWRELLDAGFPFIKRELIRDNPTGEPDVGRWREVVGGGS